MARKPAVLVVESEQRAGHSLASSLDDSRWEITTAVDAPSAVRKAREESPAVIVLSGRVIGGGGAVALRQLRSSLHTAAIPVVCVSGFGMHEALLQAGAQECLNERTPPAELRAAVAHHLMNQPVVREASHQAIRDPARLEALRKTNLLDTPAEESFDRITRLASRLLAVPTALFSLVDHDRQFFKSQHGLPEPWASRRQTPLSHSFCQWVVSSGEDLSVTDARDDAILRENRAVDELEVIAYTGALVTAPEGEPLGSLCAVDSRKRDWTEEERRVLSALRDVVQGYVSKDAAGKGIEAAARLLATRRGKIGEADRGDLLKVIEELSAG